MGKMVKYVCDRCRSVFRTMEDTDGVIYETCPFCGSSQLEISTVVVREMLEEERRKYNLRRAISQCQDESGILDEEALVQKIIGMVAQWRD